MLVLSSQHHASGINLQCARNLVLLHPYCTPSATYPEAVRYHDLAAFAVRGRRVEHFAHPVEGDRFRRGEQQRKEQAQLVFRDGRRVRGLGRGLSGGAVGEPLRDYSRILFGELRPVLLGPF